VKTTISAHFPRTFDYMVLLRASIKMPSPDYETSQHHGFDASTPEPHRYRVSLQPPWLFGLDFRTDLVHRGTAHSPIDGFVTGIAGMTAAVPPLLAAYAPRTNGGPLAQIETAARSWPTYNVRPVSALVTSPNTATCSPSQPAWNAT
jgi:hypothetical protein